MRPGWTLDRVPVAPFAAPRTATAPGIQPLDPAQWLHSDETHAAQMALRDRLIAERPAEVFATEPGGEAAAEELLEAVAAEVVARHGARADGPRAVIRADGVRTDLRALPPIAAAGRLAQEDFLVMEKPAGAAEHVLSAGVLCFPAHWTLREKMGRALLRIHLPVPEYPGDLAARVQRFFDGVKVGRPLWRANWHFAASPEIVTPMREAEKTAAFARRLAADGPAWLRVERQTVLRLPRTGAVVFGVRTLMSDAEGLTAAQTRALLATLKTLPAEMRDRKVSPALRARLAAAAGLAEG